MFQEPTLLRHPQGTRANHHFSNIFITSALPQRQQGLAGSIIMLLLHLGIAVCLGFADIVNTFTIDRLGPQLSYHAVFWFEVACAATALTILTLFVKIKKAKSEMTADEREAEEKRCNTATTEGTALSLSSPVSSSTASSQRAMSLPP